MTALAQRRGRRRFCANAGEYTLAEGYTAFENAMACIDTATGLVVPGESRAGLVPIGTFNDSTDAAGANVPGCRVRFPKERWCEWWQNDAVSPVTSLHHFRNCYILDDQTVTSDGTNRSVAGRVIAVDPFKGVLVEWPA